MDLLQKIAVAQAKNTPFFADGLFPSYRQNDSIAYKRPDENLFISASIVFILEGIQDLLSTDNQLVIAQIKADYQKSVSLFQQKEGLKTYNFYRTIPKAHFPNGLILHRLRHFKLPEDIDDTALAFLTTTPTKQEVLTLHEKLKKHANLSRFQIENTFPHYRQLRVYSTWFGEKMPIEFDACALCNLLYLFHQFEIENNEFDADSIAFLAQILERKEFLHAPLRVALNYPRPALIIYHYARLMEKFKIKALEKNRNLLIESILNLLSNEKNQGEHLLLETAFMKLSHQLPPEKSSDLMLNNKSKPFFIAGFLSGFPNVFLKKLAAWPLFQINWQSDALDAALQLENQVLKQRFATEAKDVYF